MRLALVHPEIPGNVGTLMRLSACWQCPLDVIEPLGFIWDHRAQIRASMDYQSSCTLFPSWNHYIHFSSHLEPSVRYIFLVPHQGVSCFQFVFQPHDILLVGSESRGFSKDIFVENALWVHVPMSSQARSLNVAIAASVALSAALEQTQQWPC